MRGAPFFAIALGLVVDVGGAGGGEPECGAPGRTPRAVEEERRELFTTSTANVGVFAAPTGSWGESLAALDVENRNTGEHAKVRLYQGDGRLDRDALQLFFQVAGNEPLDERLVRLAVRAAYHFGGAPIEIVSATRKKARGKHRHGEALDFSLRGVRSATLASYLRGMPLAGVGVYTHPKTQYAHLDVRDRSYHWVDASPPGVTWREQLLPDGNQAARDASYVPSMDLPESATW